MALYETAHQQEIVAAVLVLAQQRTDYCACGIIHGQKQRELGTFAPKPPVIAAVYLYQHPLPRHALPSHAMLRRPTATRAVQTGAHQVAPQSGTAYVQTLAFSELDFVQNLERNRIS